MALLSDIVKEENRHQLVVAGVLCAYIIAGVHVPEELANAVDTTVGNIVVAGLALSLFAGLNPIVGFLGLLAAYELVRRSANQSSQGLIRNYVPSEKGKVIDFSRYNQYPTTLEQEMVGKMAPLVVRPGSPNLHYKPMTDALHDAAPINYQGVI